ncbi:MAG: hypothetical protein RR500_09545 [Bacilli bacterium]
MKKNKKLYVVILSLVLFIAVGVTTAYALLLGETTPVKNTFEGAQINIGVLEKELHEDFSNSIEIYEKLTQENQTVSKVVTIKNIGGDSYVRVRLIPLIKDSQGESVAKSVKLDYTFEKNTNWKTDKNGTYYYTKELKSGEVSDVLLKSVTLKEKLPEGCTLELQVISDAIASRPVENIKTAWGIENFTSLDSID